MAYRDKSQGIAFVLSTKTLKLEVDRHVKDDDLAEAIQRVVLDAVELLETKHHAAETVLDWLISDLNQLKDSE
jgi:hypothetical protein